ncbi:MAG: hypothetical protein ACOXZW_01470 [Bacilli bacterium]|jgi:hypothetical protein
MRTFLVLLLMMISLTGCNINKIDNNYDKNIDHILRTNQTLYNYVGQGYKYYLPNGVRLETEKEYNQILYSSGQRYYLYIDIISYFHQTKYTYEFNVKAYYSRPLNFDNKQGYLEINKINNRFLLEIMYNYAKIEAVVPKNYINKAIIDSCYILSSLNFNDAVIQTLIGDNILDFKEEKFNIFEPTRTEKSFLDYIYEYDNPDDNKEQFPDNGELIIDEFPEY